jgi:hypothetical protein
LTYAKQPLKIRIDGIILKKLRLCVLRGTLSLIKDVTAVFTSSFLLLTLSLSNASTRSLGLRSLNSAEKFTNLLQPGKLLLNGSGTMVLRVRIMVTDLDIL